MGHVTAEFPTPSLIMAKKRICLTGKVVVAMIFAINAMFVAAHVTPCVTYHEREYPDGWSKSPLPVVNSSEVTFTIVVRERGMAEVKRVAAEVNDPSSATYGQFLTQVELDRLISPRASDISTVTEWLTTHGAAFHWRTTSNVHVVTTVGVASAMLRTQFHNITQNDHSRSIVRAAAYSIPAAIHEATAAIFGLHGLPLPLSQPLRIESVAPKPPVPAVTPAVLGSTYNISGVEVSGSLKNRRAVAELQGQYMNSNDLATMFRKYVPNYKAGKDDTVYKYVGAPKKNAKHPSVEANLDIQYIMGSAVGIKTEFWLYPEGNFCGALQQWSSNLASQDDAPLVHSISYGFQGDLSKWLHCQDSDVAAVDANFAKIAAKGITVLVSSGDNGAGYDTSRGHQLWSSWPASSPWVTAVGATRFVGERVGSEEMASDSFGSGGGFSTRFSQDPDAKWQKRAVAEYLSTVDPSTLPPASMFSSAGRATPDVAVLGEGYQIIVGGKVQPISGTSASTPAFGAMVSLLNEARLQASKPAMGFLNPFLYANPDAFFDVTLGSNKPDQTGFPLPYGFNCSRGWDPVTGLGTPKFMQLLEVAMKAGFLKSPQLP